jgi:hypothetical protein
MIHRIRAARVGASFSAQFLARHIGREDGTEFCEASDRRRPGERIVMKSNPFAEPSLRAEWEKGFWGAIHEIRDETNG